MKLNLPLELAVLDGLVATSREAMAISVAFAEKGQDEMAALWARFAEYLLASEAYVTQATNLAS